MKLIFWISLCFIVYTYMGYPCLLYFWAILFAKKVDKRYILPEPMISIVVAVRDEEKYIEARIENILNQTYPCDRTEIFIVSDGSTDRTNEYVERYIHINEKNKSAGKISCAAFKLIALTEGKGKSNALNQALTQAKGEFIVFTDVRQRFKPDAINELIANFNDPAVGCVSGELVFVDGSKNDLKVDIGLYWNLEKKIRKLESKINSVSGATGAIYAIRKILFQPIPEETLLDDVLIPMQVVFQGYRTVFDENAIAYDSISCSLTKEKRRKVRTLLGNYQLIRIMPKLLSPVQNPIWFRYLSHKVFRLFVPFFFIIFLFSSFIVKGYFYNFVFISAMVLLFLPIIDKKIVSIPDLRKVSQLSSSFLLLNYFALIAFFLAIRPGKKKIW